MTMSTRTLQGLVLALALAMARAQDPPGPAQDSAAAPRKFEVTSIKRANAKQRQPSLNILPGGRLNTTGTSLRRLIMFAYDLSPNQLSGASGWMDSERYDVVAKPPEGMILGAVGNQVQSTKANGKTSSWTDKVSMELDSLGVLGISPSPRSCPWVASLSYGL